MWPKGSSQAGWHLTEDGSWSRQDPDTTELYHNRAGALTEANTHYVTPFYTALGLQWPSRLRVLDACFGLGYNSWALCQHWLQNAPAEACLEITAVDNDPNAFLWAQEVLQQPCLGILKEISEALEQNIYYQTLYGTTKCCLYKCEMKVDLAEKMTIRFKFVKMDLLYWLRAIAPSELDVVFHDAFSPRRVPHLWTPQVFAAYHHALWQRHGWLLTYSRALGVLDTLAQLGFETSKTPALGGKRGGTIAQATALATSPTAPSDRI
jgi:tRNA U34 5-methylaminomethyl-2-thiouridine-forming methyltransferase MnmC